MGATHDHPNGYDLPQTLRRQGANYRFGHLLFVELAGSAGPRAAFERLSPGAGPFVAFGEGVPTRSLLANVAADIRTELRAALYRADESRKSVKVVFRRDNEAAGPGAAMTLTIHPVEGADSKRLNWRVLFEESEAGGDFGPQTVMKEIRRASLRWVGAKKKTAP